ncbi:MAG: nucleotidyltransferase domain-containing protein, partial [Gemmatimonadales bacterium]
FGSTAAGTARADSDVDLLVVGDSVDTRALHRGLAEAGLLMGREVNPVRYSRTELATRLAGGTRFVREALAGPKAWVAGTASVVAPIAIAAGIPFTADSA